MSDSAPLPLIAALEARYRIEGELGQGGMATVYLAHDLRHNRRVAVKVLRPELAAVIGAERFLQEIETTANLQHPHILPLFDSGEADGFLYFVTPYVAGGSLRSRLDRETQLSVEESVRLTARVADALAYAHARGVVHRDIKPANVLLSEQGEPLVADFGIALAMSEAGGGRLTETGLSLGTPHYMSPEQATGERQLSDRSDQYSLASMTYEMLAGDPPHTAKSAQAVLASILTETPRPLTARRPTVPLNVADAVAKALQKIPADRFSSVAEFSRAVQDPAYRNDLGSGPGPQALRGPSSAPKWKAAFIGAATVAAVALGAAIMAWSRGPVSPEVSRSVVGFLPGQEIDGTAIGSYLDVSADGRAMVYVGRGEWNGLWLKRADEVEARRIEGTEGADNPFFSPDGREVGFFHSDRERAVRSLRVVTLDVGAVRTLTDYDDGEIGLSGGEWADDGTIYFDGDNRGLVRIQADGTAMADAVPLVGDEAGVAWPRLGPDGDVLVFRMRHQGSDPEDFEIVALRRSTGERAVVGRGLVADFLDEGHLAVALADGSVGIAPFDLASLSLTGPLRPVTGGATVARDYAAAVLVAGGGSIHYAAGGAALYSSLVWIDRQGTVAPAAGLQGLENEVERLALSPDGRRLTLWTVPRTRPADSGIWIKDLPDGPLTQLRTDGLTWVGPPSWSTDGRELYYTAEGDAGFAVFRQRADGAGGPERLAPVPEESGLAVPAVGGELVVEIADDLHRLPLVPGGAATPIVDEADPVWAGTVSPDGRWLAYVARPDGRAAQVFVRPYPNVDAGRWQVSTRSGVEPVWSSTGGELFFRTRERPGDLLSVRLPDTGEFVPSAPEFVLRAEGKSGRGVPLYAPSIQGDRFLFMGSPDARLDETRIVRIDHALEAYRRAAGA